MVERVTGGRKLPREVTAQIVAKTDGVPLFIEELTKAVIESGMLTEAGDRYTVNGPITPLAIPESLHASLLARLDRLAPVREVVQIGAALGRSFSHDLISAVAATPQDQLNDALAQLVHAELIFQHGTPPDAEYTFKHSLVQDAAYSTLLRSRRQQIHARIAAMLETRFPEIIAAEPQRVAQHCAEAGLNEKAVGYWLKAGQQALARSAMTEAVCQLRKGLDLLASLPDGPSRQQQELDLQTSLGPALIATKGYSAPEVGAAYARAGALAEHLDRPDYLVPLLFGQWVYQLVGSELGEALSLAQKMEQTGAARQDASAELLGRALHGNTCYFLGEFSPARDLLERCHAMHDPVHPAVYPGMTGVDYYVVVLAHLAWTSTYLGHISEGRARINEALSEARRAEHAYTLVFVLSYAGIVASVGRSPMTCCATRKN